MLHDQHNPCGEASKAPPCAPRRIINYLRISVTDLCNYRCVYCMPPEGVKWLPHSEILTFEEICSVVRAAIPIGINRVRLTGGEPLIRRQIPELVRMLVSTPGIQETSLTTNGSLLDELAAELRRSGLSRLNVSLDSLRPQRYKEITRGGDIEKAWKGIEMALRVGFNPLKLNVVVIKDLNDDELMEFVNLTKENPFEVRFIEYMPFGSPDISQSFTYVSADEMKLRLASLGPLRKLPGQSLTGPAERYKLDGAKGTLGFITAMSHNFCARCNRIRLTADGRLLPCLFSGDSIEIKSLLRSNAPAERITQAVRLAIESKPANRADSCRSYMHSIGG
ncbi:MAG: GTP 3',8-cyclase MoaA [Candidatus Abyssubacteria bacterium]